MTTASAQSITLHFDRKRSLVGFEIINGYDKDQKIWAANSRVENVEASTGDGQVQVITLKDVRGTSRFDFDAPIETSWLQAHHPERLSRLEIPGYGDQRALSDLCGLKVRGPFSPFTGRRCRQADEGQRKPCRVRSCPSSGPSGHLLPVNGEKAAVT